MKKIISTLVLVTMLVMSTGIVPLTVSAATATIDGTEYTVITTADEFQAYVADGSGNFALASDITLDQTLEEYPYTPGTFSGTLIGVNAEATALETRTITVKGDGSDVAGLFTTINGASTFKNLKLEGTIESTGKYASGFANTASAAVTFKDCENSVDITKTDSTNSETRAAGFICYTSANGLTFTNCVNSGNISVAGEYGSGFAAGILAGTINSSYAYTFTNCKNTGDINGGAYTGGLVANNYGKQNFTVTNSSNTGDITSKMVAAGLVAVYYNGGNAKTFTAENSYNAGTIEVIETNKRTTPRIAGLVTCNTAATAKITNCFNAGELVKTETEGLSYTFYVGEIVGQATTATLTDVYDASGSEYELVGTATTPTYTDCYYLAAATGEAVEGAAQALSTDDMKKQASFNFDFETKWEMGNEAQNYYYPQIVGNEYVKEAAAPSYGVTAPTMFDAPLNTVTDSAFFASLDDTNAVDGKYSKLIYNRFTGVENAGRYGFVLSTDATLDANDTFIAATSPLAGIYFYSANAGTYYVGAVIYDAEDNIVAQSDALTSFDLVEVETAE